MLKIPFAVRAAVILLVHVAVNGFAQSSKTSSGNGAGQTWEVPFASTDNTISLSVQNNSTLEAKGVSVTFNNLPTWIEFKSN